MNNQNIQMITYVMIQLLFFVIQVNQIEIIKDPNIVF